MKIVVSITEEGKIDVNVQKGTTFANAIAMLELAKNMIINEDVKPTTEHETETMPDTKE